VDTVGDDEVDVEGANEEDGASGAIGWREDVRWEAVVSSVADDTECRRFVWFSVGVSTIVLFLTALLRADTSSKGGMPGSFFSFSDNPETVDEKEVIRVCGRWWVSTLARR
jgi:hypothetical protein